MSKNYVVGFPRIGEQRELKRVLENFWAKKVNFSEVESIAKELRKRHWNYQKKANIDFISSNDFSYYDNMLDTAIMLNAIPKRFREIESEVNRYFTMARGDESRVAMEMTKWFNTNYHYIVPELSIDDEYKLNAKKIVNEYREAKELGIETKINIIGILTFLKLSKRVDGGDTLELFDRVLSIYEELIEEVSKLNDEIFIQFDEPIFVKDVDSKILSLLKIAYDKLTKKENVKVIVTTYFESSNEATKVLIESNIWGVGLDFIHGKDNLNSLEVFKDSNKKLIAGVVDGRNIWINDIDKTLTLLKKISSYTNNLIISTSCSLLHLPYSLKYEEKLNSDIKAWLSFGVEKLSELSLITKIFFNGETSLNESEKEILAKNRRDINFRKTSNIIHNRAVLNEIKNLTQKERSDKFEDRIKIQREVFKYPNLATTTIGSFPQTNELRKVRRNYKNLLISKNEYERKIKKYIDECISIQEEIGLDVLVHGEPERNDMVEYFGEMLNGFTFTQNGWVQSYGSRCVKPPIIYGDISRKTPMTIDWIKYAQTKTKKIVKGMLTGPVTILNWSFVRDDMARSEVSTQIALSLAKEIDDLQNSGIKIIQVDEAAFKEGYPLKKEKIQEYEKWAVESFKLAVSLAKADTQIHTHMCYSEFNDIIKTIEAMDADVITIETARSGNRLLKIFKDVGYKQEVGPGIYDIHSPRIPSVEELKTQIKSLLEVLPQSQLWINPDCGLKTRKWEEVKPSLVNMAQAVKEVREELN